MSPSLYCRPGLTFTASCISFWQAAFENSDLSFVVQASNKHYAESSQSCNSHLKAIWNPHVWFQILLKSWVVVGSPLAMATVVLKFGPLSTWKKAKGSSFDDCVSRVTPILSGSLSNEFSSINLKPERWVGYKQCLRISFVMVQKPCLLFNNTDLVKKKKKLWIYSAFSDKTAKLIRVNYVLLLLFCFVFLVYLFDLFYFLYLFSC